jgi:hypothetical protein
MFFYSFPSPQKIFSPTLSLVLSHVIGKRFLVGWSQLGKWTVCSILWLCMWNPSGPLLLSLILNSLSCRKMTIQRLKNLRLMIQRYLVLAMVGWLNANKAF